jgi:predicted sugar kinase
VGIHGFGQGGFIIDAGKTASDSIGSLHSRTDFPTDWRFVLAGSRGTTGLSGDAERKAFARLPPMEKSTTDRLWGILQEEILQSVIASEFAACAEALYRYGQIAGEYFAPLQNGVYADPLMARLANHLRREGWQGVGQTSWGPTIFALCSSPNDAESLRATLADDVRWQTCEFRVAAPLNSGATVQTI